MGRQPHRVVTRGGHSSCLPAAPAARCVAMAGPPAPRRWPRMTRSPMKLQSTRARQRRRLASRSWVRLSEREHAVLAAGLHGAFLLISPAPCSWYSALDIHICWKDPSDARMEPPIQTLKRRSTVLMGHTTWGGPDAGQGRACGRAGEGRAGMASYGELTARVAAPPSPSRPVTAGRPP